MSYKLFNTDVRNKDSFTHYGESCLPKVTVQPEAGAVYSDTAISYTKHIHTSSIVSGQAEHKSNPSINNETYRSKLFTLSPVSAALAVVCLWWRGGVVLDDKVQDSIYCSQFAWNLTLITRKNTPINFPSSKFQLGKKKKWFCPEYILLPVTGPLSFA